MPAKDSIVGMLYEKEDVVSEIAGKLLAARVTLEGATITDHDQAIQWAIQTAIGVVGGVRDEIEAFGVFLSAEANGLFPDNPKQN